MTITSTDTSLPQPIFNEMTASIYEQQTTIANDEFYFVDPQFDGQKILITGADGDIKEATAGNNIAVVNDMVTVTSDYYGTCATAAATQTKVVDCPNFILQEGASIRVKFTYSQTYNGQAKLNINDTGAIGVVSYGTTASVRYCWYAGEVVAFTYDGTNYIMEDSFIATTSYYGVTALTTSATSTSGSRALTPASLNSLVQNMVEPYAIYSTSVTYNTGDRVRYSYQAWEAIEDGITSTWDATKWQALDPIQTQIDNITTMTGATSGAAGTGGLVPAPAAGDDTKFLKGDGTWATVSSGGSGVTDVTVNGTSVVSSGTAVIPLATQSGDYGLIKLRSSAYGLGVDSSGYTIVNRATTTDIDDKTAYYKPITPINLDYAVKVGVTTNANTLTSTEKANACDWIGAVENTATGTNSLSVLGTGTASSNSINIGYGSVVSANSAIQLGSGTNSTANTLQVGSYPLLDTSTGVIPYQRINAITDANADNNTYVKLWTGTQDEYDDITTKDDDTIYNITDAQEILPETARTIGQIVPSIIPLQDAGLHLLDGSLISYGTYGEFVDYMADLYDSGNYSQVFTTEATWQSTVTTYGSCGKFVYDSVNNTVRLPKITGLIEGTTDVTALGDLVEAGLPNITGKQSFIASNIYSFVENNSALYHERSGNQAVIGTQSGGYYDLLINASRSSSIYGNSSTVQPQTIKCLYYIVIANSVKSAVLADINQVATDLNGKADVDLTNVNDSGTSRGASWAFPSLIKSEDITIGASGATYTAPTNGYIFLSCDSGSGTSFITVHQYFWSDQRVYQAAYNNVHMMVCVSKGAYVISYGNVTFKVAQFIYAQGSESEAS